MKNTNETQITGNIVNPFYSQMNKEKTTRDQKENFKPP